MITMKEIAREAGTSQATVSRILSGNPAVNPDVKARVLECIKKHNYKPNIIAQSLTGSRSLLIGVIIPDISNPFFADLVKAIEAESSKHGYSLILCNTDGDPEKEKNYIQILRRYRAEGVIMVPRNIGDPFFTALNAGDLPIVISTMLVSGFSCVSISHENAGRSVARHLLENGYSHFAFVGNSGDEKEAGFINELAGSRVDINSNYRFIDLSLSGTIVEKLRPVLDMRKPNKNLGIFALNDIVGLLVLDALKESDAKIPQEVALVGFDNTFISKEVSPSLTSISQPINEIGRLSVETLISKITRGSDYEDSHILLEARLIPRESTISMTRTAAG